MRFFRNSLLDAIHLNRLILSVAFSLFGWWWGSVHASNQLAWPEIAIPRDSHLVEVVDGVILINGTPTRLHAFVSPSPLFKVAEWYRLNLGMPTVENRIGEAVVLGGASGDFYLTIHLERAGSGTRGLISVANIRQAYAQRDVSDAEKQRWLSRFPSGSTILIHTVSNEGGKQSRQLVIGNEHSFQLNYERLVDLLAAEGLTPVQVGSELITHPQGQDADGRLLHFTGKGKEATVVLGSMKDGGTSVVLNITTTLGQYK